MLEKFTIVIPTFNNVNYLTLCIESILKNSSTTHQLIVHINGLDQATEFFLNKKKILYTKTNYNVGLCSGVNLAANKAKTNYILYAHDDMYFLPNWDVKLDEEVRKINHKNFRRRKRSSKNSKKYSQI